MSGKMAKNRGKKQRKAAKHRVPLGVTAGLSIPVIRSGDVLLKSGVSLKDKAQALEQIWLGIGTDGKVHLDALAITYTPVAIGAGISYLGGKTRINQRIPSWIPFKL